MNVSQRSDKLKVFRPLYAVQYVVAPVSCFTLSYGCDAKATDAGTLARMIDKTQKAVGGQLKTMLADAAYCSIVDRQDLLRAVEIARELHRIQTNRPQPFVC